MEEFSREVQIDYLVKKELFDMGLTINELKEWCDRHAFEKGIRDPVLNKSLNWEFSFTGRWVLALMSMWYLEKIVGNEYSHYRRDIMPTIATQFKKKYDITNLPTLARKPYQLIQPAIKTSANDDYDCDGMWKLTSKGYDVLDLKTKKIKIPAKVKFSTVNAEKYLIVGDNYIYWDESPALNLKETRDILKTW